MTLPVQLKLLQETGRYEAFNLKPIDYYKTPYTVWPVPDWLFWESDVAKWIEGVCYFLHEQPDAKLREHVDYLVDLIESAQQPDGYLNIHFVVNEPDKRWTNLRDLHELYNGGHLIEAALAHQKLTGSDQFIKVMLRFVTYCASIFGPASEGKKPGYPGHPEIELALLRLYDRTGDKTSYELARFFLTERGRDGGKYYVDEQAARGEHPQLAPGMMPKKGSYWYMQAHALIKDQQQVEGHSVRAGYLLTAVADLVDMQRSSPTAETGDLLRALYRLWNSMVTEKMYVTGGVGSVKQWEGFSLPHSLPQATDEGGCYAETCAAIAVVMVSERLLAMKLDSKVADVAERALFNASVTAGMSVDGRSFTYENQLASSETDPCERHTWFQCACCPPNVLRTLGILGGFFWAQPPGGTSDDVAIHHFFDGTIRAGSTVVKLATRYPWDGKVSIDVSGPRSGRVLLRIPGWAGKDYTLHPGPVGAPQGGYVQLQQGRSVLDLPMRARLAFSHPNTTQATLSLVRGPLVYCLEDEDNKWEHDHFKNLCISPQVDLSAMREEKRADGVIYLTLPRAGYHLEPRKAAMAQPPGVEAEGPSTEDFIGMNDVATLGEYEEEVRDLTFVPYYYRANRSTKGVQMRTCFRVKI